MVYLPKMNNEMGILIRRMNIAHQFNCWWAMPTLFFCIVMAMGCERKSAPRGGSQTTAATQSSTLPATIPATQPSTEPSASLMVIDERIYSFPPARLRVRQKRAGDPVVAVLFSDDPKNAIDDNYTGNSYYMEMMLDVAGPDELGQAIWTYKSPSSARMNSTNGIFLNGIRTQLQPLEVRVEFEPRGNEMGVILQGHFLLFDAGDPNIGRMVRVSADLTAEIP